MSTSLLFRKNCAVQQVLKAGTWPLQASIFLISPQAYGYFSIYPVVAASEVVWLASPDGCGVVTHIPVFHLDLWLLFHLNSYT